MTKSKSYESIYNHIRGILISKNKSPISEEELEESIIQTKSAIEAMGYQMFSSLFQLPFVLEKLTEKEWENIKKDLEKYFDVTMDEAIFIQGREQQKRDLTWWSNKKALDEDNFFWNRYREYKSKDLPPDVISTLHEDTDKILNNIGDPSLPSFSRFGLVIGHVQSGKTLNYSAVINKATDAGYKFIVVIAGTLNNLRNQTQERLIENFVGVNNDTNEKVGVGLYSEFNNIKTPTVLTSSSDDFKTNYVPPDDIVKPILLVIKKNVHTLKNLNNWLEKYHKNKKIKDRALLVIDDESDYASINTNDENDPTSINKGIRRLLSNFEKSSYVAYTATPYANILINHETETEEGKDLFPRDFICDLKAPSNYCGPKKIFVDEREKFIKPIDIMNLEKFLPEKHKNSYILTEPLPEDLKEAIIMFYLNVAIRKLMNQEQKHNSMLIHITRFTNVHEQIRQKVEEYKNLLSKHIKTYILDRNYELQSPLISKIEKIFYKEYSSIEFDWEEVKKSLYSVANKFLVCGEYNGSNRRIAYRNDVGNNIIAVGGLSLARGFTLEGLSISYFSRTTIFYDTLMQMGRWFGYRDGYEELCKIFIPEEIAEYFSHIYNCTEDLINEIKKMNLENKTPEEFGLFIKKDPANILQVTAMNKQKNSQDYECILNFNGKLKETLFVSSQANINEKNLNLMESFINTLPSKSISSDQSKTRLWENVDCSLVIDFIDKFSLPININTNTISQVNKDFIIEFIKESDYSFDIGLYSGVGNYYEKLNINKQKRNVNRNLSGNKIKIHDGGRVSSGNSELLPIDKTIKKEIINKFKGDFNEETTRAFEIRKNLKRPLLMLHIIQPSDNEQDAIPAYGISFPVSLTDKIESKIFRINSVYIKELITQQEEEERESDD